MISLDWVNSAEHVLVVMGEARWGSLGALVGPSVIEINELHQVSVWDEVNHWVSGLVQNIPLETCEESVNDDNFSFGEICSYFFSRAWEKNIDSSSQEIFLNFRWSMNRSHLEIESLSVNCVLRASMELEGSSWEEGVSSENRLSNFRFECTLTICGWIKNDSSSCVISVL